MVAAVWQQIRRFADCMISLYLTMIDDESEKSLFESLYLKYRNYMFHIANGILNDTYLSEDAVHQAFLNVIPHLQKMTFEELDSAKTKGFLIVVTRNAAIDIYRKRHDTVSLDDVGNMVYDDTSAVDTHIEYLEMMKKINALPNKYKDVLLLKFVYGCDNKEIQSILKIKEATIWKRIQRARELLAED